MKVLVTGGAGFIGSNLVEELVKENEVVVLDNMHSGNFDNLKKVKDEVTFLNGSCNSMRGMVFGDIDLIYHLGIPSSSPMYKSNPFLVGDAINGAISIFEFAKRKRVKKIIYASSSSLYNGHKPPHEESLEINVTDYYTEARFSIERISQLYHTLYGVKSIGLRFFSVFGHHEEAKGKYANIVTQFLWDMKQGISPIIYGDGEQRRDFTFVKDVVNNCVKASELEFECDICNIGTGNSHSFNDVVDILNSKLNARIEPVYIEMPMKNYVDSTLAGTEKMKRMGFATKYSLEEGIDELLKGGG